MALPLDDAPYQVAVLLRDCALEALEATSAGWPVKARTCVVHGSEVAFDDCCRGQLSVAVQRLFSSSSFPTPDVLQSPCQPGLTVVQLVVVVLRCAPVPTGKSLAPTCEQLDDAARVQAEDAYAVRRGVSCCLHDPERRTAWRSAIGDTTMLNTPGGACAGSSLLVQVGLNDGCLCE